MQYCELSKAAEYVNNLLHEKFDQVAKRYSKYNLVFPVITWINLGRNTAGRATPSKNIIQLNTNYLHSQDWHKFLDETPLHELAHVIAAKVFGTAGHDKYWRHICYLFGLDGNRCHSFALPENTTGRTRKTSTYHTVYCKCMEHKISNIRYKRMLAGETYICAKCRQELTFTK